jgi:hypothetical protein
LKAPHIDVTIHTCGIELSKMTEAQLSVIERHFYQLFAFDV